MGNLKIKRFTLGAVKWKVKADTKRTDAMGAFGICDTPKSLISIATDGINDDFIEQTVWHEVLHASLISMGRLDLNADEDLVQGLSLLLHQFDKTRK